MTNYIEIYATVLTTGYFDINFCSVATYQHDYIARDDIFMKHH